MIVIISLAMPMAEPSDKWLRLVIDVCRSRAPKLSEAAKAALINQAQSGRPEEDLISSIPGDG